MINAVHNLARTELLVEGISLYLSSQGSLAEQSKGWLHRTVRYKMIVRDKIQGLLDRFHHESSFLNHFEEGVLRLEPSRDVQQEEGIAVLLLAKLKDFARIVL